MGWPLPESKKKSSRSFLIPYSHLFTCILFVGVSGAEVDFLNETFFFYCIYIWADIQATHNAANLLSFSWQVSFFSQNFKQQQDSRTQKGFLHWIVIFGKTVSNTLLKTGDGWLVSHNIIGICSLLKIYIYVCHILCDQVRSRACCPNYL